MFKKGCFSYLREEPNEYGLVLAGIMLRSLESNVLRTLELEVRCNERRAGSNNGDGEGISVVDKIGDLLLSTTGGGEGRRKGVTRGK